MDRPSLSPNDDQYANGIPKHRKSVSFYEPEKPDDSDSNPIPSRTVNIPPPDQYLRDWPHPPVANIASPDDADPFPLYHPSHPRYFDEEDRSDRGDCPRKIVPAPPSNETNADENFESIGDSTVDKRFAYSQKGIIKDYFFQFRPLDQPEDQENIILSENKRRNSDMENTETQAATGETDGWDEDAHTVEFWKQRNREVDYFVRNNTWSVDPIGDWSYLNKHKVPKHFLRKLRRYFEIRPMEYLRDTGSYRMFHVLNQYDDLERLSEMSGSILSQSRKMELDYLAMIWLSIWDPKMEANFWQLKEMTMSDWFFTRAGWSDAIEIRELLTKNELHSMDNLWEHRAAQADNGEKEDAEDLEDWIAGEAEEDRSFNVLSTETVQVGSR